MNFLIACIFLLASMMVSSSFWSLLLASLSHPYICILSCLSSHFSRPLLHPSSLHHQAPFLLLLFLSSYALASNTIQNETGAKSTHRLLAHSSSSFSAFPPQTRCYTTSCSSIHYGPFSHTTPLQLSRLHYSEPPFSLPQTQPPGLPFQLSLRSFLNNYLLNRLLYSKGAILYHVSQSSKFSEHTSPSFMVCLPHLS